MRVPTLVMFSHVYEMTGQEERVWPSTVYCSFENCLYPPKPVYEKEFYIHKQVITCFINCDIEIELVQHFNYTRHQTLL